VRDRWPARFKLLTSDSRLTAGHRPPRGIMFWSDRLRAVPSQPVGVALRCAL